MPCVCVCVRERGELLYACLSVLRPLMRARGGQALGSVLLNYIEILCVAELVNKEYMCVSILSISS